MAADRGKVVVENDQIQFIRTEIPVSTHCKEAKNGFESPPVWNIDIPVSGDAEQHIGILKNFTNAILKDEELISPAAEGIHSVELANAMLYSAFESTTVELPMDAASYEAVLKKR